MIAKPGGLLGKKTW